jgi:glucan phosphorylase
MNNQFQQRLNHFIIEFTRYIYRLIAMTLPIEAEPSISTHKLGWWVELYTIEPPCLYYFGEFDTQQEAEDSKHGFVQDLLAEGAKEIRSQLQLCQPKRLTVEF